MLESKRLMQNATACEELLLHQVTLLKLLDAWNAGTCALVNVETAITDWAIAERRSEQQDDVPQPDSYYRQEILREGIAKAVADRLSASPRPTEALRESFAALGAGYVKLVGASSKPPSVWDDHGVRLSGDSFGDGRYSLYEPPVRSGQAEIWKAIDTLSTIPGSASSDTTQQNSERFRLVALKRPRPEDLRSATRARVAKERLLKEARRAALLEHPNICPVYYIHEGAEDEAPFYTMRFLKDANLEEEIRRAHDRRRQQTLDETDWRRLITFLADAAAGVAYAHKQGFVHLDLKPANIAVDNVNGTQVFDWGQASSLKSGVAFDRQAALDTTSGPAEATQIVYGTPAYAAPEQILKMSCSTRTDIFQLGAILYEILTGNPPYLDESREVSFVRGALGAVTPLGDTTAFPHLRSNRLRLLVAICEKAMRPDPGERYQTVDLLREDLIRWLDDEPISVRTESVIHRWRRTYRKNRRVIQSSLGIVMLFGLLATAGAIWNYFEHHHVIEEHYQQIVFGQNGPHGLRPVARGKVSPDFSTYRAYRRGWSGPIHKIEQVNAFGRPSFPSTMCPIIPNVTPLFDTEGASRVEYIYEKDRLAEERGFNLQGMTLWWIKYDFHHDLDGVTASFKRVSKVGTSPRTVAPELRSFSGAAALSVTWNSDQIFNDVRILDVRGVSVKGNRGEYGIRVEYRFDGQPTRLLFLGANGEPSPNLNGIMSTEYDYDAETGDLLELRHLNQAGEPAINEDGYAIAQIEHDSSRLLKRVIFLDESRQPISKPDGLASISFKLNSDHNLAEVIFFDKHEKRARSVADGPASISLVYDAGRISSLVRSGYDPNLVGFFSHQQTLDDRFRVVEGRCFDKDGKFAENSIIGAIQRSTFNDDGTERKREYFGSDKRPFHRHGGETGWEATYVDGHLYQRSFFGYDPGEFRIATNVETYDDFERATRVRWYGENGQPSSSDDDGVYGWNSSYHENELESRREYVGADGGISRRSGEEQGWTAEYSNTTLKRKRFFGHDAKVWGFETQEEVYDDSGVVLSVRFLKGAGQPATNLSEGVAGWDSKFDDDGREIRRDFVDVSGVSGRCKEGHTGWITKYAADKLVQRKYLGFDAKATGYQHRTESYDDAERIIRTEYLDGNERPVQVEEGYSGWTSDYDQEQLIRKSFWGYDETKFGYSSMSQLYDAAGRQWRVEYRDATDKLALSKKDHVAGHFNEFNSDGQVVRLEFLGIDGQPATNQLGHQGYSVEYAGQKKTRVAFFGYDPRKFGYASLVQFYDDAEQVVRNEHRDSAGRLTPDLAEGVMVARSHYSSSGKLVRVDYLGADEQPARHKNGSKGWTARYHDDKLIEKKLLGYDVDKFGYASQTDHYDTSGRIVRVEYRDLDDHLAQAKSDDIAGWVNNYDSEGNVIRLENFGVDAQPAHHRDGYMGLTAEYDSGRLSLKKFYGYDIDKFGYTSEVYVFNSQGRASRVEFRDSANQLRLSKSDNVAGWSNEHNSDGQITRTTYFGIDGTPAPHLFGYEGQLTEYIDGKPIRTIFDGFDLEKFGYSSKVQTWDESGRIIREERRDTEDQLCCAKSDGIAFWTSTFESSGAMTRQYFNERSLEIPVVAIVDRLEPEAQGFKIGIKPGDVIVSYDGKPIDGQSTLIKETTIGGMADPTDNRLRPLVVQRGSELLTFEVRPGRIGLAFNDVAASLVKKPSSSE